MKTAIVGVMNSGKTHSLKEIASQYKNVAYYDPINSRNSDRDLANLNVGVCVNDCLGLFLSTQVTTNTCLLVDEVHLFEVFKRASDIDKILFNSRVDTYFSGLLLDCYNNYRIFPIWSKVFGMCDNIRYLKSRVACRVCGNTEHVIYTVPVDPDGPRIGDAYYNCCVHCISTVKQKGKKVAI